MTYGLHMRPAVVLRPFLFLIVSAFSAPPVSSLYLVTNREGHTVDYPTESCLACGNILFVDIPNVVHEAGRLYLVNNLSDCKVLGNTLIESTSVGNVLYYDISLVDGLTCYPQTVQDSVRYTLTQVSAEEFCGRSMCESLCTSQKDPHECQISQPYTHRFGDMLRQSALADSRVYTYPYDDEMGLLRTNESSVRMTFYLPSMRQNVSNSVSPKAKSGTVAFIYLFNILNVLIHLHNEAVRQF